MASLSSADKPRSMSNIHPAAIVSKDAILGERVTIGAGCVIEDKAEIGNDCVLGCYVLIKSGAVIGARNRIGSFTSIGDPPQDTKHDLNKPSLLKLGDDNLVREYCSFHGGSSYSSGCTTIGNNNFFMSYVHVGHDGYIGDNNIFANSVGLAGHVKIGNNSVFGAYSKVAQHGQIGSCCMVGASADVHACMPSYWMVSGARSWAYGINKVGLRRLGMSREQIDNLAKAFRFMYLTKPLVERIKLIRSECAAGEEIDELLASVKDLPKGIVSRQRGVKN